MNKFYNIADENKNQINDFQLINLGIERVSMIVGSSERGDYGIKRRNSQKLSRLNA